MLKLLTGSGWIVFLEESDVVFGILSQMFACISITVLIPFLRKVLLVKYQCFVVKLYQFLVFYVGNCLQ